MKIAAAIALVLAVIGWGLTFYIGNTMLSGIPLAERSCQTACVQGLFFFGFGLGAVALGVAAMTLIKKGGLQVVNLVALILALPLFAVYAGIVVIGKLA
jgi:hypothetical protein